jgi:hypothetical protein
MNLSASPGRPACPSRASGWSSLTPPWGLPCCVRFPCVHAVATTPAQRLGVLLCSFTHPCQPSPIWPSGRPAHCPFRGLLGVHSRYGLHTRAVTVNRDTLTRGFSHFVTSMTAPVASGWSGCRVGLTPTGKRRLFTAHATCRLTQCSEHRRSANHRSLTTITVIGFADPGRGIKNATAGVHRGSARRSPGKGNENVI